MRPRYIFPFFLVFSLLPFLSLGQKNQYKQPRILILLDGSSSMVNKWTPNTDRFKAASNIVLKLMDSIYKVNPYVEFSLRVYGHQHQVPENNCYDTKQEVMFSHSNMTQMELRLANLHPKGVSPIAYSLKQVAEADLTNERDYAYSLVLITDGGESCGGNICDVVQNLLDKKIEFRPYIVSLVDQAPLKEQYACLGTYLQASKPEEVPAAIGTITEAYRRLLAVPIARPKINEPNIVTKAAQVVNVAKTTIPKQEEPEKQEIQKVASRTIPVIQQPAPKPVVEQPVERPRTNSRIQVDMDPVKKETISRMQPRYAKKLFSYFYDIRKLQSKTIAKTTIPRKDADTVRTLITSKPAASTPKPATPKPVTPKPSKANTPAKPKSNTDKIADYKLTKEVSKETTLQVYFTNGKGKYYSTTPRLQLVDPKTNAVVHRFYRTTDASGNPDPVKVPAGNYDLRFEANPQLVSKSVTIEPQNNQKLVITVHNAGLQFVYLDNEKRPMSEYAASVKKLFDNYTPTFLQPCDTIMEYEPGTYHVEIPGMLPPNSRTVELGFDFITTVHLPQDGFVQFTNTNTIGRVRLFYQEGNRMTDFYLININGQPDKQKLRLQPGRYEAHYNGKVHDFMVVSNHTTEAELK